jgi:hypothetical protein
VDKILTEAKKKSKTAKKKQDKERQKRLALASYLITTLLPIIILLNWDFLGLGVNNPFNDAYWFAMVMAFIIFDMTIGFEVGFSKRINLQMYSWRSLGIFVVMWLPQLSMALVLKSLIGMGVLDPIVWSLAPMIVFGIAMGAGSTIKVLTED